MRECARGSLMVKDDYTCERIDADYFARFGAGAVLTAVVAILDRRTLLRFAGMWIGCKCAWSVSK